MLLGFVGLITVLRITLTEAVVSSDITRTYAFDCATFKVDYKESPDSDYKYELEIPSNTELKAVSTSNKVILCGIPLCIPQVLKFTISKKLKTETDFRKIFTEEFEKTLGAPRISDIVSESSDSLFVTLRWKLQDRENCKNKILVFNLYGDTTIMQLAKGEEMKIPGLKHGQTYTIYAFPSHVDSETHVYMSAPHSFTVT
ncbi:hypothetical protein MS3_00002855 [Schistosoma haematobium]|uniref:Fibronectin type-III domain-containing protein n=1 Tax=Schistosoma haematobium TaxID=6185 RepID=A0A094ZY52_SCHHA|nr:hypothetical protein MS3_00002855 [Schistosoma haematobium]KAH9590001.1 hypothetical protein MS3_00002855 [Schistosoma haematobium]CAH8648311.1 unnamed protein product [Schistosoma haematobium]CAH8655354.1 unnamed protein product [Schistosoma haematobium]